MHCLKFYTELFTVKVFEFVNRNFRVLPIKSLFMNISWGSSWDPENALKTYKNISGQPYSQDDKFAKIMTLWIISMFKVICKILLLASLVILAIYNKICTKKKFENKMLYNLLFWFQEYKAISDSLENCKIMHCIMFSIIIKPNFHY